jgi:hypothetical protein
LLALVIIESVVLVLVVMLVAGLLRSHADIIRALHDLGVGVGDPSVRENAHPASPVPVHMGAPLPPERDATSAPALSGVTPDGDAVAVAVTGVGHPTLIAFLSSGCTTCSGFWESLQAPARAGLPPDVRVVAVTRGPEAEIAAEVRRRAGAITVVMSTEAWLAYEVPGSPFFVLVDGVLGRRIGEGVANHLSQVAELVRRATVDGAPPSGGPARQPPTVGLSGPAREARNDEELMAAGVHPGDPSLYPERLEDLFAPAAPSAAANGAAGGSGVGAGGVQ